MPKIKDFNGAVSNSKRFAAITSRDGGPSAKVG
jgi:hypothetical protein